MFSLFYCTVYGVMEPQLGGKQLYFANGGKNIYIPPAQTNVLHYLEILRESFARQTQERKKIICGGKEATDCGANINTDDSICISSDKKSS